MVRLRVGGVAALPPGNYVQPDQQLIPDHLAGLEAVPGRCFSREPVAQCPQSAGNVVCAKCAMVELGEHWEDFKARTNAGLTVAAYQRKLAGEQLNPDQVFVRARAWAARQRRDADAPAG